MGFELLLRLPDTPNLKADDGIGVKLVVPIFRAKHLEQLSRGQLKLRQPSAFFDTIKSENVCEEACSGFQVSCSHTRPRIPKHSHKTPPVELLASKNVGTASENHLLSESSQIGRMPWLMPFPYHPT